MKKFLIGFTLASLLLPSLALAATFTHDLSYGTTGTDVSSLQQFLADEGLFSGTISPTFGPLTRSALMAFQRKEGISATGYFGALTRADANAILAAHPEWTTPISNSTYYKNVNGSSVHSPAYAPATPAGATAICGDGTYSFSLHHSGSCSHHGGGITMAAVKKNLFVGGSVLLVAFAVFLWALLTGHLPNDKNGYHYEYFNGHLTKVKDFVPPPGTQLMQKQENGRIVNYYGSTTPQ